MTCDSADRTRLVAAARGLGPRIWELREEIERRRGLPAPLVQALAAAGLFRLMVPHEFGGCEVDPVTAMCVIEEVAKVDGSVGWLLMTNNCGLFTAWLTEAAGRAFYESDPDVVVAGTLVPTGRAVAANGGYRASGRWAFASGIEHCAWLVAGCIVTDGDRPLLGPDDQPGLRALFLPAADCTVVDTWSTGGLRGTGSHDVVVTDVFVPAERTFIPFGPAIHPSRLYAFPFRCLGAALVAAVPLGIARGAIDAFVTLAGAETAAPLRPLRRDQSMIQSQLARAEADLRAARAFLVERVAEMWEAVAAEQEVSIEQQALLRLAATNAGASAARAVDLMYDAGGSAALYTRSPLERAFRDVHTATHHFSIQSGSYESIGRVLLGLPLGGPVPL